MRLFVAVDLSDEARRAIAVDQNRLAAALTRSGSRLTLVRPELMHVTLLFLGELPEAQVPGLVDATNIAVDAPAFEIGFEGVGVFPPHGVPRAVWIGVAQGAAQLMSLRSDISDRVRGLGIAFDDRRFHPHLTLARWRASRSSDRAKALGAAREGEIARVHVDRATLYRSHLSTAGPTYTPLAHARLTSSV